MRTTKLRMVAMFAVIATAGLGSAYRLASAGLPNQKDPPPAKVGDAEGLLKKAMLEDARKVFEQDVARYKNGLGVPVEELYQWSSRWLEAELDLAVDATAKTAALKTHLNRMKDTEKMATALAKSGDGREADAAASRYYRAQAELWLARGRIR